MTKKIDAKEVLRKQREQALKNVQQHIVKTLKENKCKLYVSGNFVGDHLETKINIKSL